VVASDILPMDALAGVDFVQGDFREQSVAEEIRRALGETGLDVLLSDMAPNLSGMDAIDAPRSMYLAELALETAQTLLKPDGSALIKLLQGAGFQEFVASARREFRQVRLLKPEASRSRSPETYLLASGRRMV
jgi:23S rRNA (uridine2552-2'-O)-methyltransferase